MSSAAVVIGALRVNKLSTGLKDTMHTRSYHANAQACAGDYTQRDWRVTYRFCFLFVIKYSRLSLSRLLLSRITAYLEEKIWSLFKHRNVTSGNKILRIWGEIFLQEQFLPFPTILNKKWWIRGEIAPQKQYLTFPTIFSIYISN